MKSLIIFITLIATIKSESVTINCTYYNQEIALPGNLTPYYTCNITNDFTSVSPSVVGANGAHADGKTNDDVQFINMLGIDVNLLPSNLEEIFKKIIGIKIEGTALSYISQNDLKVFPGLKYLYLARNSISVILRNTFSENLMLELIDLQLNFISFIDSAVFDDLIDLKYLYLADTMCPLSNVEDDSTALVALKAFIVSNCSESNSLQTLLVKSMRDYVDANQRSENCVGGSSECEAELIETQAELVEIQAELIETKAELVETKANLTTAETSLSTCQTEVTSLNASVTSLTSQMDLLEEQVENCVNPVNTTCRFRTVTDYGYSCVANGIFINSTANRAIEWDGEHAAESTNALVVTLMIANQNVEILPSNITNFFPNLKNLVVQNSKLAKLSKSDLESLTTLERLEITQNAITSIESSSFDALIKLKFINLSGNQIISLPSKSFDKLTALTTLNISNNNLTTIRYDIIQTTNVISKFYAGNNRISSFDITLIWRLNKALVIDLKGSGCQHSYDKETDPAANFMTFFSNIIADC